jgi:16S rRNA (uracil1498-N3)-methyltransferase
MSLSRFHLPPDAWDGDSLVLTADEAAHCARVQRHRVGDAVEVGDGAGRVAEAQITDISKGEVRLRVTSLRQHDPLPHAIHLLPALIKAEPFEWLLEKAVELGAASIRPVITERTIVHLGEDQLEKKLGKWRRHMIESMKQCHTPYLPALHVPRPFAAALEELPPRGLKLLPALSEGSRRLRSLDLAASGGLVFAAIGPEGDFTPEEEMLARSQGFLPVTLGPLILRAETAAVTVLAILGHELAM